MRTTTAEVFPAVGFATRGISVRSILAAQKGELLPVAVAMDIGLAVARLVRAEHGSNKVVGAFDASRVALMVNGTISLMAGGEALAPELKNGGAPSQASDIYAIGHLLYQMLTGRTVGDAVGSNSFSKPREVPAPSDLNPEVPPELSQLVLSCLRYDPKQRPNSARGVEQTLSALTSDAQLEAALALRLELVKQHAPDVAQAPKAAAAPVFNEAATSEVLPARPPRRTPMVAVGLLALVLGTWLTVQLVRHQVAGAPQGNELQVSPPAAAPAPAEEPQAHALPATPPGEVVADAASSDVVNSAPSAAPAPPVTRAKAKHRRHR